MGFIGAEVAASARARGLEVAVVEPNPRPISSAFSADVAAAVISTHVDQGAAFHLDQGVTRLIGDDRVETVVSGGGNRLEADWRDASAHGALVARNMLADATLFDRRAGSGRINTSSTCSTPAFTDRSISRSTAATSAASSSSTFTAAA